MQSFKSNLYIPAYFISESQNKKLSNPRRSSDTTKRKETEESTSKSQNSPSSSHVHVEDSNKKSIKFATEDKDKDVMATSSGRAGSKRSFESVSTNQHLKPNDTKDEQITGPEDGQLTSYHPSQGGHCKDADDSDGDAGDHDVNDEDERNEREEEMNEEDQLSGEF